MTLWGIKGVSGFLTACLLATPLAAITGCLAGLVLNRAKEMCIRDRERRGVTIVQLAKELGAEKFLHYSFPRHMAMPLLAKRADIMKEEADVYKRQVLSRSMML